MHDVNQEDPLTDDDGRVARGDVLILGGGFAGVWCARRLRRRLPANARITLVSAENHFVFQPLLPEVVGGSLEPGHVISPLRQLLPGIDVARAEVVAIDAASRRATVQVPGTEDTLTVAGDHLVLALGSIVDVSRIPGMTEHALWMKNVADALALRQAIIAKLERAVLERDPEERRALLTFVVVGGGFSGIETAAEMLDLLHHARRFYRKLAGEPLRVVCLEARDRILGELHPRLGEFAQRLLQRRGLELRLQTLTRAVSPEGVHLQNGEVIATRTVVCTIGNAPHPALVALGVPMERGRLVTDEFLRVRGHERLWAIGDCAHTPDGHGGIAPPTGQFATRQGARAGENIAGVLRGAAPAPFRYRSQGQLATLGHHNAVAWIRGVRFSGFFAWWLWRTIYLLKLPRLDRKLQVVIDWTLRLVVPRDLNVVDVRPTRGVDRLHLETGEVLFRQGDPSSAFYVIESGCIELTQVDAAGNTVLREQLTAGAHFGEGSLLRTRVRRTTARACEPSKVLAIPARRFDQMLRAFAGLRGLLQNTSRRFLPTAELIPPQIPPALLRRAASEVMTSPVYTLPAAAPLRRGLIALTEQPHNCYPLLDEQDRLAGVVTRADLYKALGDRLDLERPLLEVGTRGAHVVAPSDSVARCVELMRRYGVAQMPVVDDARRVIGMLAFRDLLRDIVQAYMAERGQPVA